MASNYPYKRLKKSPEEDEIVCEICCNRYDGKNCRPKNLPCGHTFCNNCMAREIGAGRYTCATCRKPHKARFVTDLPQNVELERLIRNKTDLPQNVELERLIRNKKMCEDEGVNEDGNKDETTGGACPKHNKTLVYFYCQTHSLNVCRECTVIDHPVTECNLISFKEGIEKSKEDNIQQSNATVMTIKTTIVALSEFVKEQDDSIKDKEHMLQQLARTISDTNKKVDEQKGAREKARTEMLVGQTKLREIESAKRQLLNSKTEKAAVKYNNEFTSLTRSVKNWITEVSTGFNFVQKVTFDQNAPSPISILKGIMNGLAIYAETTSNNRTGYCKFTVKDEKLHQHHFKFETSQTGSTLVEYQKVQSYFQSPPTLLFLDLAYRVCRNENKGRVYIRLKPELHTFIKNIPSIFTGENGSSIVGNSCIRKAGPYNLGVNIENSVNDINQTKMGPVVAANGDVVCNFHGNSILHLYIYFKKGRPYPAGYAKIGSIESGIEIIEDCRKLPSQEDIFISDCGLVLDI